MRIMTRGVGQQKCDHHPWRRPSGRFGPAQCGPHRSAVSAQQPPDVAALLARIDDLYRSKSSIARIDILVTSPRTTRSLRMRAWSRGEDEALVIIEAPPREEGIATLRVGQNLWNYLPRIARTIRVPPSMMLGSWMGTDFTNDDLVKESSLRKDFTSRLGARSTSPAGWWIVLDVKPGVVGRWSRIELLVSDELLPVEEKHFDRRNRLARTMTFDEIKTLGGRRLPDASDARAHRRPGPTDRDAVPRTAVRRHAAGRHLQPRASRARKNRQPAMTTWRIAWRNLWRNKRRTALALAAIALSVTLVLLYDGILRGYSEWMVETITGPMLGHAQVHAPEWRDTRAMDRTLPHVARTLDAIRRQPGVTGAEARVYAPALAAVGTDGFAVFVMGLDIAAETRPGRLLAGATAAAGRPGVDGPPARHADAREARRRDCDCRSGRRRIDGQRPLHGGRTRVHLGGLRESRGDPDAD